MKKTKGLTVLIVLLSMVLLGTLTIAVHVSYRLWTEYQTVQSTANQPSSQNGQPQESSSESIGTETLFDENLKQEIQPVEKEPEKPEVSIMMVGDMLMHMPVVRSGQLSDGSYNYDHLFANVIDSIQEADLAIVNQETILGGSSFGYSGYPNFNSPVEVGEAEAKAGFNIILHATNHTLDMGLNGVQKTMEFWNTKYPEISYLGISGSQEQRDQIYVFEKEGLRIAVLNYTYGMNGYTCPSNMTYLVNTLNQEEVVADIARAHEMADFVVVCPHWGTEYRLTKDSMQEKWTQIFLENGVDLVIGAHPHVIEPVEWVSDDQGHRMLVYYSLGNFVNGTVTKEKGVMNRMIGGIAKVTVSLDEQNQPYIKTYSVVPIICHPGEGTDFSVYYLSDYTQEMVEASRISRQDSTFSLENCYKLVEQVWGDLYKDHQAVPVEMDAA